MINTPPRENDLHRRAGAEVQGKQLGRGGTSDSKAQRHPSPVGAPGLLLDSEAKTDE